MVFGGHRKRIPYRNMTETERIIQELARKSCQEDISLTGSKRNVIDVIENAEEPFCVSDIVSRAECARGIVYKLVKELVKCGFLERLPKKQKLKCNSVHQYRIRRSLKWKK